MWPESDESPKPLRSGLTTGTCATACCIAAASCLLLPRNMDIDEHKKNYKQIQVTLPRGEVVTLTITEQKVESLRAYAATIKDAGDDPDVTHGATVFVWLTLTSEVGVTFRADHGVGTVTQKGLVLAVGEAAINPVPRNMITEHLTRLANRYGYGGGFCVSVGVKGGEQLALKTMNPRLGIIGGLSILGTTGIVRPFSCAAYIASIRQGMDVACANGLQHIAATTGSTSEAAIRAHYQLSDMALIEMGDFVGAVLKYAKKMTLKKLTLCGGFGKISKLANGHLDLHSRKSSINFQAFAAIAQRAGADQIILDRILQANTSMEVLQIGHETGIDFVTPVCHAACVFAQSKVPDSVIVEVWATDRQGKLLACATA